MAKRKGKRNRLYRCSAVLLSLLVILFALLGGVFAAEYFADRNFHFTPQYEKIDLFPLLQKLEWTDEDYDVLYHQTGLTKIALNDLKAQPLPGKSWQKTVTEIQDAFFFEYHWEHEDVAITTKRDCSGENPVPVVPLQAGDVLVSACTHSFGWRHGHAALSVDDSGTLLESISLGTPSMLTVNGQTWFAHSSDFIVLRLKDADKAQRKEIADRAKKSLLEVPYHLTVGIFSKKDQGESPKSTHCSHLVWQAYKNCGYDIDANGGAVVSPRDIARSPYFEVIQVFGFDPDKLW